MHMRNNNGVHTCKGCIYQASSLSSPNSSIWGLPLSLSLVSFCHISGMLVSLLGVLCTGESQMNFGELMTRQCPTNDTKFPLLLKSKATPSLEDECQYSWIKHLMEEVHQAPWSHCKYKWAIFPLADIG